MLLDFSLVNDEIKFTIPFLVSSEKIKEPILEYNVIENLVLNNVHTIEDIKMRFTCGSDIMIENIVALIQDRAHASDFLGTVKASANTVISAGTSNVLKCY